MNSVRLKPFCGPPVPGMKIEELSIVIAMACSGTVGVSPRGPVVAQRGDGATVSPRRVLYYGIDGIHE